MPFKHFNLHRYVSAHDVEYPSGLKKADVVAKVDALGLVNAAD